MKASTKEMLRRALRTFLQAAVGYVSVNIAYAFANAGEDYDLLASSLLGIQISAVAAGLAAVMNLPVLQKKTEEETAEPAEDENIYEDEEDMK